MSREKTPQGHTKSQECNERPPSSPTIHVIPFFRETLFYNSEKQRVDLPTGRWSCTPRDHLEKPRIILSWVVLAFLTIRIAQGRRGGKGGVTSGNCTSGFAFTWGGPPVGGRSDTRGCSYRGGGEEGVLISVGRGRSIRPWVGRGGDYVGQ